MSADAFRTAYGSEPEAVARAPGRVNLIGEHIDYTGGTVLPTVVPQAAEVALTAGGAGQGVRIVAPAFGEVRRAADAPLRGHWSDYVLAGHRVAVAEGLLPPGGAAYAVTSQVPPGAGLSSSAAVLVALLRAAARRAGRSVPPETLARWARRAETEEVGVPCGIMDQMAIAAGRPGHAMALDTASLIHEAIPLPSTHAFVVVHSGLVRSLADGAYAERRGACAAAAQALGLAGIGALSGLPASRHGEIGGLPEPERRRARHAVTEHARVRRAITALREADMARFGALMDESHASMRDDFEIVPPAMDAMVAEARRLGATGARLTGGGFGGCFVACVPTDTAPTWRAALASTCPGTRVVATITGGRDAGTT